MGISTALTTDPEFSLAKLYVGVILRLFTAVAELAVHYVGPETFLTSEDFLDRVPKFNWLVEDIRNNLDDEEPPAYYYDMGKHYMGGTEL